MELSLYEQIQAGFPTSESSKKMPNSILSASASESISATIDDYSVKNVAKKSENKDIVSLSKTDVELLISLMHELGIDKFSFRKALGKGKENCFPNRAFLDVAACQTRIWVLEKMKEYFQKRYAEQPQDEQARIRPLYESVMQTI